MIQACEVKSGNCRFFSMSVLYHCDPVLLKSVNYQSSVRKKKCSPLFINLCGGRKLTESVPYLQKGKIRKIGRAVLWSFCRDSQSIPLSSATPTCKQTVIVFFFLAQGEQL